MIKNSQDDNSEVLESSRSPAEALRQQILKDGTVHYMTGAFIQKHYSNNTVSPIEHKAQEVVEIGIDDLIHLVTAYAATVEREAAIKELNNIKDNHPIVSGFHADCRICKWIDDRLAALQGTEE